MSIRRTIKLNYYPLLVKQFWSDNFRKKIEISLVAGNCILDSMSPCNCLQG